MDVGWVAAGVSLVTLLIVAIEKIFGGGHSLATKFSRLEKNTYDVVEKLRVELYDKVDGYEDNYAVGIDAIKSNIHALQLGLLEFRAKMAEQYMPKTDHQAGIADIRREVHDGFEEVRNRLDRMEGQYNQRPKSSG